MKCKKTSKLFLIQQIQLKTKSWRIGAKTRALKRCIATCVRVGWNRMFLCMWNRICIFLGIIFNFYFNLYVFSSGRVLLTSLGCRCRPSEGRSLEFWLLKLLQRASKDEGGWYRGCEKYGYGIWIYDLHTKLMWETDVEIYEGRFVWRWCWW